MYTERKGINREKEWHDGRFVWPPNHKQTGLKKEAPLTLFLHVFKIIFKRLNEPQAPPPRHRINCCANSNWSAYSWIYSQMLLTACSSSNNSVSDGGNVFFNSEKICHGKRDYKRRQCSERFKFSNKNIFRRKDESEIFSSDEKRCTFLERE